MNQYLKKLSGEALTGDRARHAVQYADNLSASFWHGGKQRIKFNTDNQIIRKSRLSGVCIGNIICTNMFIWQTNGFFFIIIFYSVSAGQYWRNKTNTHDINHSLSIDTFYSIIYSYKYVYRDICLACWRLYVHMVPVLWKCWYNLPPLAKLSFLNV